MTTPNPQEPGVHAAEPGDAAGIADGADWLTPGVAGIGPASFLSDLGHEVPTSLLPTC